MDLISSYSQLQNGNYYYFNSYGLKLPMASSMNNSTYVLRFDYISNFKSNQTLNFDYKDIYSIGLGYDSIYFNDANGNYLNGYSLSSRYFQFDFRFDSLRNSTNVAYEDSLYESVYAYESYGLISNYSKVLTEYTGLSLGVLMAIVSVICLLCLVFKRG